MLCFASSCHMNYHPVCVQNLGFKTILESFFVPISMRHFIIFIILFMIVITYFRIYAKESFAISKMGVVQKLHGQDEVGRWSKNASFCPRLG